MKLVEDLQKASPFILTAIDGRPVFLRKNNPIYTPKKNDRIVSMDCVLANEDRLIEVTEELYLEAKDGVFELQA